MKRTVLPPLHRHPVHGEAAKAEARRLMRLSNVLGLGPVYKKYLCRVAKGQTPLELWEWTRINAWHASQLEKFEQHGWPLSGAGRAMYLAWKKAQPKRMKLLRAMPGMS